MEVTAGARKPGDLDAARLVRAEADRAGVRRIVYVSGIIPPVPEEELSDQLAARLPIAVVDLARAVGGALTADVSTRAYSVGGGEPLPCPKLIYRYADTVEKPRPQIILPGLPEPMVAKLATLITDVPPSTVTSLMESLREDRVAEDSTWIADLPPEGADRPLAVGEALRRSVARPDVTVPVSQRDPMGRLPGDPSWAATSA